MGWIWLGKTFKIIKSREKNKLMLFKDNSEGENQKKNHPGGAAMELWNYSSWEGPWKSSNPALNPLFVSFPDEWDTQIREWNFLFPLLVPKKPPFQRF